MNLPRNPHTGWVDAQALDQLASHLLECVHSPVAAHQRLARLGRAYRQLATTLRLSELRKSRYSRNWG